jgi:hypothetical protein
VVVRSVVVVVVGERMWAVSIVIDGGAFGSAAVGAATTYDQGKPAAASFPQRSSLLSPRALFHQAFTLEGQSTSFLPFTSILCVP